MVFLSGCSSAVKNYEYKVLSEEYVSDISVPNLDNKNILFVFDTHFESAYYNTPRENAVLTIIAETIVKNIVEQGGHADHQLTSSAKFIVLSKHNYILKEEVIKVADDFRQWTAKLYDVSDKKAPKLLYQQLYSTKGALRCFESNGFLVPPDEACQIRYIQHLLGHLSLIGISNDVVQLIPAETTD